MLSGKLSSAKSSLAPDVSDINVFMSEEEAEGLLDLLPPPPSSEWDAARAKVQAFLTGLRAQ